MASNISQNTTPYLWTSAGDDIIYTFSFNEYNPFTISDDGNGYAEIVMLTPFDVSPTVGEYIFMDNPSYFGNHKIREVISTSNIVLETTYTVPLSVLTIIYHLRIPEFTLYKGFNGEVYDIYSPYTAVSNIKPSPLYDENGFPYIEINVKGLCSRMFDIQPMTEANSDGLVQDFNMFNAIRIVWDGLTTDYGTYFNYTLVLNSTITNAELLQKIVTGFYLTPTDKLLVSSQGVTFGTYMKQENIFPILHKYINGVLQ